ncbi:MAG: C25 family cysteine peptidase [Pirellulales bacterium]
MLQTLLVSLLLAANPSTGVDTLVVCPDALRGALRPWIEYRQAQGHRIMVIAPRSRADRLRDDIRQVARSGGLRFLVLVGDARSDGTDRGRKLVTPTGSVTARVNVLWGSTPRIATDNVYADLDDDGVPDLASGRLPADRPAELSRMIAKTIAYERQQAFGPWRRRFHFVAGPGGFGPLADKALEVAAKSLITSSVPDAYRSTMTYASWQSAYCPDPLRFREMTARRLNEGSLFWIYIGHGHWRNLDMIRTGGIDRPILTTADVGRLECPRGHPIAVFLCCYAGAFDAPDDCLAEEIVRQPGAPVAALAGTRVTMPYGMAVLGTEFLHSYFHDRPATLGETLLAAKQAMMADRPGVGVTRQRAAIDLLASAISPAPEQLSAERMEHVAMFHLFGDPLLRLRYPHPMSLDFPATIGAGSRLTVSGDCDVDGRCSVELAVLPGRLPFRVPARGKVDLSTDARRAVQETYERANEPRVSYAVCDVRQGRFQAELTVPANARGQYLVRTFVAGKGAYGVGSGRIRVMPTDRADATRRDVVIGTLPQSGRAAKGSSSRRHTAGLPSSENRSR